MKMKKIAALALAVVLSLGMSTTVFAKDVHTGQKGSGTLTITNASYGTEYKIYKVFDATLSADGSKIAYTSTVEIPESAGLSFYTDKAKNVILKNKDQKELTEADIAWITNNKTEITLPEGAAVADGTGELKFDELQYGYYYITTANGTVISINGNQPDASVVDKNTTDPTPDSEDSKTVTAEDTTIGQDANYEIKFRGTNYASKENGREKIFSYKVVDTSTGVKIHEDTIAVTVGETPLTLNKDYTVTPRTSDGTVEIIINWTDNGKEDGNHLYQNGSLVTITYEAEILAVDANNEVSFNWNNDHGFGGDDDTRIDNHEFDLNKIKGEDQTPLDGAVFTLSKNGEKLSFVKNGNTYTVANSEDKADKDAAALAEMEKITAGSVTIEGLGEGTYILTEETAPDGYNKLEGSKTIVIGENGDFTVDGESQTSVTIENFSGSILPSTGGIGTTIFYVVGGILVVAAVVLLVTKKRMSNRA